MRGDGERISDREGRRSQAAAAKRRIVEQAMEPGASIARATWCTTGGTSIARADWGRSPSTAFVCCGEHKRVPKQPRRPPDQRRQSRTTRARAWLESLHEWLQSTLTVVSRKSEIAAAIRYALGGWYALLRYSEDGHIEIDNNAAERALRAVALGRKNYLFADRILVANGPRLSTV